MTKRNIKVVLALCSRGLVYSKSAESMIRNLNQLDEPWRIEAVHDHPIPSAQNEVTRRALLHDPEWIWYFEEDIVAPDFTLRSMIRQSDGAMAVAARYRLSGGTWAFLEESGKLVYAGMGCLIVHRSVFGAFGHPWFRVDQQYGIRDGRLYRCSNQKMQYGGHDVHFFFRMQQVGIRTKLENIVCGHLRLKLVGNPGDNSGCHKIVQL